VLECHYTTGTGQYDKNNLPGHNLMHLYTKIQVIEGVSRTETFISLDQQIDRQISIKSQSS
jgi:Lrp/AsnC family transcriptional regulator for asnA, asnC and gidA